jgi:hypothetical protein
LLSVAFVMAAPLGAAMAILQGKAVDVSIAVARALQR